MVANADPDIWYAKGTEEISREKYLNLKAQVLDYLQDKKLYIRDMRAGADLANTKKIRVITQLAWQNLMASSLFIEAEEQPPFDDPDFTVIAATGFKADPANDGLRSPAFIILDFVDKVV